MSFTIKIYRSFFSHSEDVSEMENTVQGFHL